MSAEVSLAGSEAEISRCCGVIRELRPHLDEVALVQQVKRQQAQGYQLAYLESDGEVCACAGFRILEYLAWGRTLYVDDLVTAASDRSRGHGAKLFSWLVSHARAEECKQLHLDSGVQRFEAHRFYLRERMDIIAHHFALRL